MTSLSVPHDVSLGLEDFCARVLAVNPFTDNRVNSPASQDVDVAEIHRGALERLTTLVQDARGREQGLGVLLWGEAGIGKSHLLARLGRWAHDDNRACFLYLHNLQASPDHLPRSLLRAVLSILTLGRATRFRGTPLFRMTASFAHEAFCFRPDQRLSWSEIGRAFNRLVDRLGAADPSRAALTDRTVFNVLFTFLHSSYLESLGEPDGTAALAVRWLSGDYLDPHQARRLGLPGAGGTEPVALSDNQEIKQVLAALCRLAQSRRQTFLLCFDQADNLDVEQMAALSRFLEALLDSAPNLLVVTAGIQASLLRWREQKVIQDSAWDRLAQNEIALQRIRAEEACRIVAARLARFLEPHRDLDEVQAQVQADPLFPLGQAWFATNLEGRVDLRPRDVITRAREGWQRQQEALRRLGSEPWLAGLGQEEWGPGSPEESFSSSQPPVLLEEIIDQRIKQEIEAQKAQRQAESNTLPPDGDHLAGLIAALLDEFRQADPSSGILEVERPLPQRAGVRPSLDLVLRLRGINGQETRTGLLFMVTDNAVTAAAYLRRLVQLSPLPDRLMLVTDQRRPLALGGKGQEHLEQLRREMAGRFRRLDLSFLEYVTLNALQAVVGLARSGELEIELLGGRTQAIDETEILASLHRQGFFQTAPVMRELLASV